MVQQVGGTAVTPSVPWHPLKNCGFHLLSAQSGQDIEENVELEQLKAL